MNAHLFRLLFLKLDHPLQPVDGRVACQEPRQLRVRAHVRLPAEQRSFGLDAVPCGLAFEN